MLRLNQFCRASKAFLVQVFCQQKKCLRRQYKDCRLPGKGQISIEFIISTLFVLLIFGVGLVMFQQRTEMNFVFFNSWEAKQNADILARNINNVYLMDNNSQLQDYVYWFEKDRSVEASSHNIRVFYDVNYFVDSPVLADINWAVTSVNGLILFTKQNDKVVITNG
jgi:uncharacterized protein (UPF0333 family)